MEKTEFEIAASMLRGKLVDIARFYLSDEDEAEDIVQEAMLKLWLVRDRLDREKNIAPMGMTITRNLCIDRLRRLKTHPHESLTGHDAPDGQRSAQAMMEDRENAEWMRGAVRNLPDKYRAVLRMRQVEHLEMGEIARIIGATEGVVRTILSRARKQMMEGEFYQFNLSSCIRQQNSLTAQFVSFSLSNLANIFYPPQFLQ